MTLRLSAALLALMLCVGCGDQGGAGATGVLRSVSPKELERWGAIERDCIYYRVATNQDGSVVWNADYVYFYLLDKKGHLLKDGKGDPVASGLLFNELKAFMAKHPELGDETQCGYQISRQVQTVKSGRVVRLDSPVTIRNEDLSALLDRAGRSVAIQ